MGTFCSFVPNIFAGITEFSNTFNNILSLKGKITDIISKITNFDIKTLISDLSSKISSLIDKLAGINLKKLKEFSIANSVKSETFNPHSATVYGKMHRLKTDAERFFEKDNMKNVKDYVDSLLTYAISIFKSPGIKEAEFLVYRFCSLMTGIENNFNSVLSPLKSMIEVNNFAHDILQRSGNINTARALNAGAKRFYMPDVQSGAKRSEEIVTDQSRTFMTEITPEEYDNITKWNGGSGDSRIGFRGRWVGILKEEGWSGVEPVVKAQIMRVQSDLGRRLWINSGYRPKWYNDSIRQKGAKAAKNSLHIRGMALDVWWEGFEGASRDEKRHFVETAFKNGFKAYGGYSGFIHVDIGPKRHWGLTY
jgi:hypothetical protein